VRREQLSSTAVALARAASAPAALADALSARHVALWSAPHLDERVALADEMIALGARTGDPERELQGRNWRFMDLLELGDVTAAEEELRRHGALADRLRLPGFQWWDPMWSAMLALVRGRIDDAGRLRARALALGRRAGDKVAELFAWIQDFSTRWETADEELDGPPEEVAVRPVQSALRSDLPLLLAEAGRREEARAELDALAENGFAAVPDDLNWLASIAGLSQAAAALGDGERAQALYDLMVPYRSRAILVGRAAICLGPADLYLGVLAGACEEFDLASQHFDAARAWCDAAGATLWSVWCDVHRARMMVGANASGARLSEAAALAAHGLSSAERTGLGRAARHAREVARAVQAAA
jgi:tetratricopeptide (TPR) repeat protein